MLNSIETRAALLAAAILSAAIVRGQTVDEIFNMSRNDAQLMAPCVVTGVVTSVHNYQRGAGTLASVDDPDGTGVYFYTPNWQSPVKGECVDAVPPEVCAGDVVEITGRVDPLGFVPGIRMYSLKRLGAKALLRPPLRRLSDFDWGRRDNSRATLSAIVVDAEPCAYVPVDGIPRVRLVLGAQDGFFAAYAPGDAETWRGRIDSVVELSGVAMSFFDFRGEFRGVRLETDVTPDAVRIVASGGRDPFSLPATPLSETSNTHGKPPLSHRIHVRGVVTYSGSKGLWIDDGTGNLRVEAKGTQTFSPGDSVDAAGFLFTAGETPMLRSSVVRKSTAALPPIVPAAMEGGEKIGFVGSHWFENYDGRLVTARGKLIGAVSSPEGSTVNLAFGRGALEARLDAALPEGFLEAASFAPQVEVTGVFVLETERGMPRGFLPEVTGGSLLLRSPDDICILPGAAFRRAQFAARLQKASVWTLVLVSPVLLFVLWRLLRLRRQKKFLDAMGAERKRMAGDLHDTVEQHLVGVGMVLENAVATSSDPVPAKVLSAVELARRSLAWAKEELRAAVWNLRSDELFSTSPRNVLERIASRVNAVGAVKVGTKLEGLPDRMDRRTLADIVLIVQEAITNAIKHGKAKNVTISVDSGTDGRGFALRIANDGLPFDAKNAPGAPEGHFGVSGMKERAERRDISIAWSCEGDWTTVTLEVPS